MLMIIIVFIPCVVKSKFPSSSNLSLAVKFWHCLVGQHHNLKQNTEFVFDILATSQLQELDDWQLKSDVGCSIFIWQCMLFLFSYLQQAIGTFFCYQHTKIERQCCQISVYLYLPSECVAYKVVCILIDF